MKDSLKQIVYIPIKNLDLNKGQIEGVPTNPRQWTKNGINKLAKSIKKTPELMEMRPCLVYEQNGRFVVISGNMRTEALRINKINKVPCIIIPTETSTEKLKEIAIKDNGTFGEWDFDILANVWDDLPLKEWGVPFDTNIDDIISATERLNDLQFTGSYYTPIAKPKPKLEECMDESLYEEKINFIERSNIDKKKKILYKKLAERFRRIDFEGIANYYTYCATEEEKTIIERLRCVIIDGGIGGFIDDGLTELHGISYKDIIKEKINE